MMTRNPLDLLAAAAALVEGRHACAACGAPIPDGAGALAVPLDWPTAAALTAARVVCARCGITGDGLGELFPRAATVGAIWPAAAKAAP